jgi:hypothetical protein
MLEKLVELWVEVGRIKQSNTFSFPYFKKVPSNIKKEVKHVNAVPFFFFSEITSSEKVKVLSSKSNMTLILQLLSTAALAVGHLPCKI